MIRFRIGQSWMRERAAAPVDSFGLEIDGINLLSGATEEQLSKVVPELMDAVTQLTTASTSSAQLSLPEAHLELCLYPRGSQIELRVASLARPARLMRAPLKLETADLVSGAVRCGKQLLRDLSEAAPKVLRGPRFKQLRRQLIALESGVPFAAPSPASGPGFSYRLAPRGMPSFGLDLDDADELLRTYSPRTAGALPSLLVPGAIRFRTAADQDIRVEGPPYMLCLELSRQALELASAMETGESRWKARLAGAGPELIADIKAGMLELAGRQTSCDLNRLLREMLQLPLALRAAVLAHHPPHAQNPYLVELGERCQDGLGHLRSAVSSDQSVPVGRPGRSPAAHKPLKSEGKLRRLRFELMWEKTRLGGEGPGKLLLAPAGPIFVSPEMCCAFNTSGELLYKRIATHGVAAALSGETIIASHDRVMAFRGPSPSAHWLRDHDGAGVGPELALVGGRLVTLCQGRGAVAFDEMTGREVWRVDPPRTQRGYLTVLGHRILLATDSGFLYGLDASDGQLRFRMRAALPFTCPVQSWGRKLVGTISRGGRTAVFTCDAKSGNISWTRELDLTHPSQPLIHGGRLHFVALDNGDPVLMCLTRQGNPMWKRSVPLIGQRFAVLSVRRSILAVDGFGGAVLVDSEGKVAWRLGTSGDELAAPTAPVLSRDVLIVPGEQVRAVDPKGGRVLAEVKSEPGLCDLKADARLNLYLLTETGTLRAYRLSSHLAVI